MRIGSLGRIHRIAPENHFGDLKFCIQAGLHCVTWLEQLREPVHVVHIKQRDAFADRRSDCNQFLSILAIAILLNVIFQPSYETNPILAFEWHRLGIDDQLSPIATGCVFQPLSRVVGPQFRWRINPIIFFYLGITPSTISKASIRLSVIFGFGKNYRIFKSL